MKFIIHFSIALLTFQAYAQGSLTGVVTGEANEPLADVNVSVKSLQRGTSTDKLGRFKFSDLPTGTLELSFSSIGYTATQVTLEIHPGENPSVAVVLKSGELLLADVVVTDKFEREINTLSQVDIKLRPISTAQDILRMIPGLFIAQHAGGGKGEQIFLRGFDIDHGTDINIEVDGLPVNMVSHAHGQGYSDLHFLIPEVVGTVDFNKGPYYGNKGNLTTAGYVSFNTRNAFDQNFVKIEGGRFGMLRNVNAIQVLNQSVEDRRSNAYVATEYFRTDGFFENAQNFNRINIMGKYTSSFGDDAMLTVGFSTFQSSWDASGQIPTRAVDSGEITRFGSIDPTEGGETARTNAWVRYLKTTDDGGVFDSQVFFSHYDFNLISNFTFYLNDPVNGDQITQQESRSIYGYRGTYNKDFSWAGMDWETEAGIGLRYDDVNDLHLFHTRSRKQYISDVARGDVDETNLYAYWGETVSLSPKLTLNAALRLDQFIFNYVDALTPDYARQQVDKIAFSPKFNVSYNPTPSLNLFLKTGIGFHSNDTRVVVAQSGEEVLPKAYGLDLGGTFKPNDNLLINGALWMLDLDQEFVYVGDEGIVEPSGKTHRQGIDLSVRYQLVQWLYIDADINLAKPRAKGLPDGENYIPLAPILTSIGGLSFRFDSGVSGSLRYRYMGDRPAKEDNSVVASGYFLADATIKYTRQKFEVGISAENLFNIEWNEAQFDTESRLFDETDPVLEIHFTPGTPLFVKLGASFFF